MIKRHIKRLRDRVVDLVDTARWAIRVRRRGQRWGYISLDDTRS